MKSPNNQKRTPVVMALSAALAITLVGLAEESAAAVIAVNSNLGSTYVSTSVSGSFDISSALAGNTATSGSITAMFSDDGYEYAFQGSGASGNVYASQNTYLVSIQHYCCGWDSCANVNYDTDYYYTNTSTDYFYNPIETARLSAGASIADGSSSYDSNTYAAGSGSSSSWNGDGYNYYTTYYYDQYSGYTGNFSITLNLDAAALADLNADGLLGFGISALSGDFMLNSVGLTADLVANQVEEPQAAVPEPGLAALMGIGLVGLGLSRRSRKQKVSAC